MAVEDKNVQHVRIMPHSIIMENRQRLSVSGVEDVLSFDDAEIEAQTTSGTICIRGEALRIGSLSTESGEMRVEGRINEIVYFDETPKNTKTGFFSRVFG